MLSGVRFSTDTLGMIARWGTLSYLHYVIRGVRRIYIKKQRRGNSFLHYVVRVMSRIYNGRLYIKKQGRGWEGCVPSGAKRGSSAEQYHI